MSKHLTFVTGYPRSRTCWLSELLTVHRHSFAYHEGSIGSGSCLGWRSRLDLRPEPNVIDCNAATLAFMHGETFRHAFPSVNYVLVIRDKETCRQNYTNFLGDLMNGYDQEQNDRGWELMEGNFNALLRDPDCIKIDYESLDDPAIMRKLCEHIAPGYPWDQERFDQLKQKKIVQNLDAFVANLAG